jgi:HAD superfamily 5'-nucleotidase-like hydrolase
MAKPIFTDIDPYIIEQIHAESTLLMDPASAVYTNRDLDLSKILMVGYDMDYTLAVYHKQPMEQLQYVLSIEALIHRYNYPQEIRTLVYDPSMVMRGLVVDKRRGHLLKLDAHGQTWRGMHGRRQLSQLEIDTLYKDARIRIGSEEYPTLDTLFAMPEASLYCNLIDFFDSRKLRGESLEQDPDVALIFDHVRNAIDGIHADGTLKTVIMKDPAQYISSDPKIALTLHRLRSVGKKIFLLTNSHWDYTNAVMTHILAGKMPEYTSWRSYFDIVIVGAQKPAFFTTALPMFELAEEADGAKPRLIPTVGKTFERTKIYQGGSIKAFEALSHIHGGEILYVGDHIYGDILRSKKESMWRTCLVLDELPGEIQLSINYAHDMDALAELDAERFSLDIKTGQRRALLAHLEAAIHLSSNEPMPEPTLNRLYAIARTVRREIDTAKKLSRELDMRAREKEEELERRFHPIWGRLLREHNELSRFGAQVTYYACIYTGHVANFLQFSPMHIFRSPSELMAHDRTLLKSVQVRHARHHKNETHFRSDLLPGGDRSKSKGKASTKSRKSPIFKHEIYKEGNKLENRIRVANTNETNQK